MWLEPETLGGQYDTMMMTRSSPARSSAARNTTTPDAIALQGLFSWKELPGRNGVPAPSQLQAHRFCEIAVPNAMQYTVLTNRSNDIDLMERTTMNDRPAHFSIRHARRQGLHDVLTGECRALSCTTPRAEWPCPFMYQLRIEVPSISPSSVRCSSA